MNHIEFIKKHVLERGKSKGLSEKQCKETFERVEVLYNKNIFDTAASLIDEQVSQTMLGDGNKTH
mgnify:CR=1 FL=1